MDESEILRMPRVKQQENNVEHPCDYLPAFSITLGKQKSYMFTTKSNPKSQVPEK
jgi:hypothetical protein